MNESQERNPEPEEIEARRTGDGYELVGRQSGKVGEITFQTVDEDTWMIDHTYVDPRYRGKQFAKQLLNLVVDEARAKGKKLIPSCSYALAEFRRHEEEYKDVWDREGRA
jgi:predicted GNAT family acetyltransferase